MANLRWQCAGDRILFFLLKTRPLSNIHEIQSRWWRATTHSMSTAFDCPQNTLYWLIHQSKLQVSNVMSTYWGGPGLQGSRWGKSGWSRLIAVAVGRPHLVWKVGINYVFLPYRHQYYLGGQLGPIQFGCSKDKSPTRPRPTCYPILNLASFLLDATGLCRDGDANESWSVGFFCERRKIESNDADLGEGQPATLTGPSFKI